MGQKMFYAYLGMVGKTFDQVSDRVESVQEDLQSRYTTLTQDRKEIFGDLVTRGEKVQEEAGDLLKNQYASIEGRMDTVKEKISNVVPFDSIQKRLQSVSERFENLRKSA